MRDQNHITRNVLILAAACFVSREGHAQTGRVPEVNMVRVLLQHGVSVSIPRNWVVQDAESNRRRFAVGKAVMDLADIPSGPGGVLLTASPDGNPARTSVIISLMRRLSASQTDVASLEGNRLDQVNAQFKTDLESGMRVERATLIEWGGSAKVRLGDLYSLVSRYTYTMPGGQTRTMESHRIFLGGGSVGFMLQAPVGEVEQLRPIFAAIRGSLRASAIR